MIIFTCNPFHETKTGCGEAPGGRSVGRLVNHMALASFPQLRRGTALWHSISAFNIRIGFAVVRLLLHDEWTNVS